MSSPAVDARRTARRPRILRIISRLNVGGPARHAVLLNAGLQQRGFETLLVHGTVGAGEGSFDHLVQQQGIAALRVPTLGRRLRPVDDMRAWLAIRKVIRDFQPDLVHTHTAKAGALGRAAAALPGALGPTGKHIAIVHTFHGHVFEGYFNGIGSWLARLAERGMSRVTDCTIAISERQRHDLVERFHVAAAARTVVVPLGLQLDALLSLTQEDRARARAAAGLGDAFVVGFVGRLVPIKHLELLIDAIAIVRKALADVRLVITGDGPERPSLEGYAREAGLEDVTLFAGWREDLAATYAILDAVALTSKNEGTPVALIEAMAAGVPVVATAVGGVPDVIADGETGLLTSQSAPAIADALVKIARDRGGALGRAAGARENVQTSYSDRALLERMAGLYEELLRGNRSAPLGVRARLHEPA